MEVSKIKKLIKTKNNKDVKTQIDTIKTTGIILMMVLVALIVAFMFIFYNNYSNRTKTEVDNISTTRITNSSREIKKRVEKQINESYELLKAYAMSVDHEVLFPSGSTRDQIDENINDTLKSYATLYSGFDEIKIIRQSDCINYGKILYSSKEEFISYIAFASEEGTFDFFYEPSNKKIYFGYSKVFTQDSDITGIYGETSVENIISTLKTDIYDGVTAIALIDTETISNSNVVAFYDNYYKTSTTFKFANFSDMILVYAQEDNVKENINELLIKPGNNIVYLNVENNDFGSAQICYISDFIKYSDDDSCSLTLKMALIVPQSELSYQISSLYRASFVIVAVVLSVSGVSIGLLIIAICNVAIKQKRDASYDDNTGLLNLSSFKRDANIIIHQNPESKFALIYITIMKYHFLRQIYDAEYIDGLIASVGQEIKNNFATALNGFADRNKYIILLPYEEKRDIVDKITAFQSYMNIFKYKDIHGVELSYGIKRTSVEELVSIDKEIESSILASKSIQYDYTKTNYGFYNAELDRIEKNNAEVELKGQQALKDGRFEVFYQLKKDILNDKWIGSEALVRWRDEDGKLIPPGLFIPIFEENGFVVQIDAYVFENVCKQLRDMLDKGEKVVPVSVNLSKKHFRDLTFINVYEDIVNEYNIPHELIEFEITEGLLFENINVFKRFIGIAHSRGYKCSMDDFGSGYSSLNIISELDFDTIKIDQRFFRNSNGFTEESKVIISSIITLCHKLGKKVIAEGAEEFEQVKFLKENKCDMIQSYYYSKPIPYNEYKEKLNSEK